MTHTFTSYTHGPEAFLEVERFLSESVGSFATPRNWFIDRWNFTSSVSRVMHKATIAEWESGIGLWRDEQGRIVAMAHEEEQNGDVFFEFDRPERVREELLTEMFDFAERACPKKRDQGLGYGLRVPVTEPLTAKIAVARGYRKSDWTDPLAQRPIPWTSGSSVDSPERKGLTLIEGTAVEPEKKALAHAQAFGYAHRAERLPESEAAFRALLTTPSYRSELDLAFADREGRIACFVGLWFDPVARVGILEPVGTVPEYRRKGLAKALIDEGTRRLEKLGAEMLFVGSDQEFYRAIGFSVISRQEVWEYRV